MCTCVLTGPVAPSAHWHQSVWAGLASTVLVPRMQPICIHASMLHPLSGYRLLHSSLSCARGGQHLQKVPPGLHYSLCADVLGSNWTVP